MNSDEIERIVEDFRAWLRQFSSWAAAPAAADSAAGEAAAVDWHTVLGQFTALRHEVNLQTKSVRTQQEQNAAMLGQLSQSVQLLEQTRKSSQAAEAGQSEETLRPLLKTLVELHDALLLGYNEMTRLLESVLPELENQKDGSVPAAVPEVEPAAVALPFWLRWLGAGPIVREALQKQRERDGARIIPPIRPDNAATERVQELLDSAVTGYTMGLQRVERALGQHNLEVMDCAGQPFDPEAMEVLEVIAEEGRPNGEVIEEVRRGYRWRGRVFRFALVRVAKS